MEAYDQYATCLEGYARSRLLRNSEYDRILKSAQKFVDAKRDRDRLRPSKFNIFRALGCDYKEDAHSSLLAYLLNPSESHNQGLVFLRSFLKLVQEAANNQGKNLIIALPEGPVGWVCRKEMALPGSLGRTDIVVRGPKFIAVIENKICAGDQDAQLARYWEFVDSNTEFEDSSKAVIYLTPDGRSPTKASIGDNERMRNHLILLSHNKDMHNLFREISIELVKDGSAISIAEVLLQYAALIEELA